MEKRRGRPVKFTFPYDVAADDSGDDELFEESMRDFKERARKFHLAVTYPNEVGDVDVEKDVRAFVRLELELTGDADERLAEQLSN